MKNDARLVVLEGSLADSQVGGAEPGANGHSTGIPIPRGATVTIGRRPDCTLRFDNQHLVVSGRHAAVYEEDGRYYLRDEQSRNGTLVNGQRVTAVELRPGDVLQFGLKGPRVRLEGPLSSRPGGPEATIADAEPPSLGAGPAADEAVWYYLSASREPVGPLSREAVVAAILGAGQGSDCLVWAPHLQDWMPALEAGLLPVAGSRLPPRQSGSSHPGPAGAVSGPLVRPLTDPLFEDYRRPPGNRPPLPDGGPSRVPPDADHAREEGPQAKAGRPRPGDGGLTQSEQSVAAPPAGPRGVRGFLLLLVVGLTVGAPVSSLFMVRSYSSMWPILSADEHGDLRLLLGMALVIQLVLMPLAVRAGLALWRVRPHAVVQAQRFVLMVATGNTLWLLAYYLVFRSLLSPEEGQVAAEIAKSTVLGLGGNAMWYAYLKHSKRVAATYPD